MIPIIDVIFIVIIFGFIMAGWIFGLIHTLGSLLGSILGIVIASRLAVPLGEIFAVLFGGKTAASIIFFILVFLIVSRLVGFVFYLLGRAFKIVRIIPFIKSIDRILGGFLGFLEGVILVAAVVYFSSLFLPEVWLDKILNPSLLMDFLLRVFNIFIGLVPNNLIERIVSFNQ